MSILEQQRTTFRARRQRFGRVIALTRALVDLGGTLRDSLNTVREYDGVPWRGHRGSVVPGVGLCGDQEREYLRYLEGEL